MYYEVFSLIIANTNIITSSLTPGRQRRTFQVLEIKSSHQHQQQALDISDHL